MDLSDVAAAQPAPQYRPGAPSMHTVAAALHTLRRDHGFGVYGSLLQVFNGRSADIDEVQAERAGEPAGAEGRAVVAISREMLSGQPADVLAMAEAEQRGERPHCACVPIFAGMGSSTVVGYSEVCREHRGSTGLLG